MLKRHAALNVLRQEVGVSEQGGNNAGPRVELYQRADTLPGERYAWCMSLQQFAWRMATGGRIVGNRVVGGELLSDGTASCGFFTAWARQRGYIVDGRPEPGDHITFLFDGDSWEDHVGMVERLLSFGPVLWLQTIEGNTGSSGSVSDPGTGRDAVHRKRRLVRRSKCRIIRVPGAIIEVSDDADRATWPRPLPPWFWPWARWRLGEGEFKGRGFPNMATRPKSARTHIPAWAFARLRAMLADRQHDAA